VQLAGYASTASQCHQPLGCPDSTGNRRGDVRGQLAYLAHERSLFVHRVDEPGSQRLAGIDPLASEDHLRRVARTNRPNESLGTAPARWYPELDLGLREHRVLRAVADVAGESQLAAATESEPIDSRDHRLRELLDSV